MSREAKQLHGSGSWTSWLRPGTGGGPPRPGAAAGAAEAVVAGTALYVEALWGVGVCWALDGVAEETFW